MSKQPDITVVLVNWNGAEDSIACVRSLLSLQQVELCVVIVDNASGVADRSRLLAWLEGSSEAVLAPKPLEFEKIDSRILATRHFYLRERSHLHVVWVENKENYGFAVANNIGAKIGANVGPVDFFWFLNNDTEVHEDCLHHLIDLMGTQPDVGMCGSALLFHGSDDVVQAYGGVEYSYMTARGVHIGAGERYDPHIDVASINRRLTYVSGASMFVRQQFLEKVGLMSEDYFLYNEEADWAWRARGIYSLAVAPKAVVYHKEGASIGTESQERPASVLSDFFQTRNKLIFAKKYTPQYLPIIWSFLFLRYMKRVKSGLRSNARVMRQVLLGRREPDPAWFIRK